MRGEFPHPPDGVASPASEEELRAVLDWCGERDVAVVPVGGGTSVVGGIDAPAGPGARRRRGGQPARGSTACSRSTRVSRAARIQAGATGPRLEEQLAAHGLTLRFYPQSFELSTLGGWIATRAGGHFASGPTHVDDLVESVRALTVGGDVWESRRLPGSGAGPSPDRMLLGSEGTLAVDHRGVGAGAAAARAARALGERCAFDALRGRRSRRCARSCRRACGPPTAAWSRPRRRRSRWPATARRTC